MSRKTDAHDAVQRDLQAERAAALACATERLEAALAGLAEAERAFAAAPTPAASELRRAALAHAGERLWFLVIQREAVGLNRHEVVFEALRVPREVRRAMGPRPRR